MSSGFRQGDPLVPFLFVIVAYRLRCLFKNAIRLCLYQRYKVGVDEMVVSLYNLQAILKLLEEQVFQIHFP